jgi:hypothetical protein
MEKKNVKEATQKLKEQDMEQVAGGATTKKRRPEVILQPNDKKIRKF